MAFIFIDYPRCILRSWRLYTNGTTNQMHINSFDSFIILVYYNIQLTKYTKK